MEHTKKLDVIFQLIEGMGVTLSDLVLYGHILDADDDGDVILTKSIEDTLEALADAGFDLGDHDGHDAWENNRSAVRDKLTELGLLSYDEEEDEPQVTEARQFLDTARCVEAGEHLITQRHPESECPAGGGS
jgi:hypothetical protein